jgi:hypothetical protein
MLFVVKLRFERPFEKQNYDSDKHMLNEKNVKIESRKSR